MPEVQEKVAAEEEAPSFWFSMCQMSFSFEHCVGYWLAQVTLLCSLWNFIDNCNALWLYSQDAKHFVIRCGRTESKAAHYVYVLESRVSVKSHSLILSVPVPAREPQGLSYSATAVFSFWSVVTPASEVVAIKPRYSHSDKFIQGTPEI